jgi:hypothetical protein
MRVKALVSFNAYNLSLQNGDTADIEDKDILKVLKERGWIEPAGEIKKAKTNKED